MKCSDPECNRDATRELLGVAMCEGYYIEALEHSAHIVTIKHQKELAADILRSRSLRDAQSKALEDKRNAKFITFNQWVEAEPSTESAT